MDVCEPPIQIYFSNDLKRQYLEEAYLLGYKFNNIYIVFCLVDERKVPKLPKELKDLQIIGSLNKKSDYDLNLVYDREEKLLRNGQDAFLIYFDPPNFKNLEYFSITPILLQSMGTKERSDKDHELFQKLERNEPRRPVNKNQSFISDDNVLEKINHLYRNRLRYRKFKNSGGSSSSIKAQLARPIVHGVLIPLVMLVQRVLITIISVINYKCIRNHSLVEISKVFRHSDLRLKQFNYFPTQFLCYYDKSILYAADSLSIVGDLKLPIFNSNLNINNSNYINLYNSIWLIFNDVLLGMTLYTTILERFPEIVTFIKDKLIEKYLFDEMLKLITWITTKNPAGFKLNTDLGKFLGDLYIWTMWFWKIVVDKTNTADNYQHLLGILKFLCYFGGCSFLLSFLLDLIALITFHIHVFYYCSAKVYRKQLEVIKSLFQLFRGKKYNVLRNRIDNLNNYEITGDAFEIDQLLLGTLIFMIMIFLLPTVFAFYLVFSCIHVIILMTFNFLENLSIVLCFTPLFVILLKLKNSKRLQGGIKFDYLDCKYGMTLIKLSNKSLTYLEIFTNFIKLFKRAKNFRNSILLKFLTGQIISIEYDYNLKFNYLMLPQEYSETINIWKFVK
ncbi:N-acetylglucosaminyl-phosphatidylinositol biosynthetic protein gpi1 [Candida viswanathii]|uniref:N-acetylglucosaminyl-phosphatidylinositol biosynthetic protein gpi1 n=1 Tax=Candida viswanathii TaxID=5486 RepID=A0A367YEK7_9ASCO|nr:N-acetylglucosaminyl-phosphatidylinositol biosynthetic protein gpi1 [Candida viswanathii]